MPIRKAITDAEIYEMRHELAPLIVSFDLLPTHIVITDIHGNILYANKAAQDITGYQLNEMLGKNPGDLWGGHEDDQFYKDMWQTIKVEKKPYSGKVKNHSKSGQEFIQQLQITPLLDKTGEPKYFVSIEPDVTVETELRNKLNNQDETVTDLYKMLLKNEQKISDLSSQIKQQFVEEEEKK
jgi:PAS domain S-box-containing protein